MYLSSLLQYSITLLLTFWRFFWPFFDYPPLLLHFSVLLTVRCFAVLLPLRAALLSPPLLRFLSLLLARRSAPLFLCIHTNSSSLFSNRELLLVPGRLPRSILLCHILGTSNTWRRPLDCAIPAPTILHLVALLVYSTILPSFSTSPTNFSSTLLAALFVALPRTPLSLHSSSLSTVGTPYTCAPPLHT